MTVNTFNDLASAVRREKSYSRHKNALVISYGPSGVGFVNFGFVKNFTVNAPLQTYGLGARGYNQYDGTVDNISLQAIETFAHGSVAIQISKKIGTLIVDGNVTTHGSIGSSLVKEYILTCLHTH